MVDSGRKFLILAHGFGTDQSTWNRIFPFSTPTTVSFSKILFVPAVSIPIISIFADTPLSTTYVDHLLHILVSLGVYRCTYVGHSVSTMIGILASIRHPELFSKLILVGAFPRFLNDQGYYGGFEQGEIEKVFSAMEANYKAWVNSFAPLAVGADVPAAVREFSRTLFNMRLDISLFVSRIFDPF